MLTVGSDRVTDSAGHALDGDGNGLVGGDSRTSFHRMFGDINGAFDFNNDGRIDIADFGQFSIRLFVPLP